MSGRLTTGMSGLGRRNVSGRRRVPRPAPRTKAVRMGDMKRWRVSAWRLKIHSVCSAASVRGKNSPAECGAALARKLANLPAEPVFFVLDECGTEPNFARASGDLDAVNGLIVLRV